MRFRAVGASGAVVAVSVVGLLASPAAAVPTNAEYVSHSGNISMVVGPSVEAAVETPDDGQFIQMDNGSEVLLAFPAGTNAEPDGTGAADLEVDIFDALFPACAELYGSLDNVTYFSLLPGVVGGTPCPDASNEANDVADVLIDLDLVGQGPVHYVKVVQNGFIDQAFPTLGFDLDAVIALNTTPLPAADPLAGKVSGNIGRSIQKNGTHAFGGLVTADGDNTNDTVSINYKGGPGVPKDTCTVTDPDGPAIVDNTTAVVQGPLSCTGSAGDPDVTFTIYDGDTAGCAAGRGAVELTGAPAGYNIPKTCLDTGNAHVGPLSTIT